MYKPYKNIDRGIKKVEIKYFSSFSPRSWRKILKDRTDGGEIESLFLSIYMYNFFVIYDMNSRMGSSTRICSLNNVWLLLYII